MKIENITPFDSEHLRAIAQKVASDELDPHQRNGITIHFVTRKGKTQAAKRARTIGYYRRRVGVVPEGLLFNQAIVTIPLTAGKLQPVSTAQHTALLLAHEFAEMRGLSHDKMRTPRYFSRGNWIDFYRWAENFPLQLKAPSVVSPVDVIGSKLSNAMKRRKSAATRHKRASTILKKWDRKVKYYEKQLALRGTTPCA